MQTCPVLNLPLAATDYAGAVATVRDWGQMQKRPYLVAAANTHVVALGRHDPDYGRTLDRFDLLLPDGMPLVWCMNRLFKAGLRDRVYGPTFMLRCLEVSEETHFLMGGTEELLATLTAKLRARFPKLEIVGTYSPPFGNWSEEEDQRILAAIRDSGAQFVWVGLGCPKQENWLARNKDRLPPAVYSGVGAAFAFHAGRVRQAPAWIQRMGMEWAFRLMAEPRRLWKRYVVYNTLFLFYLARQICGGRSDRSVGSV